MQWTSKRAWMVGLLCLTVVVTALVWRGGRQADPQRAQPAGPARAEGQAADAEYVMIGGVRRKATDLKVPRPTEPANAASAVLDYGQTPRIPVNANPQVAQVAAALKSGKHPERVTSAITPAPFDRVAYEKNPQAYLSVVEPGRVWQPAQPGPGVARIKAHNGPLTVTEQNAPVTLQVEAVPHAPVTFTTLDLGEFENRLTSITVQADNQGLAQAKFTGTPGTINDVHILAASPLTAGQVRYIVHVLPPRPTAALPGAEPPAPKK